MEPESLSIAEAISRVKAAIRSAQMKGEFDFDIDKLELTLKVLSEKDVFPATSSWQSLSSTPILDLVASIWQTASRQ